MACGQGITKFLGIHDELLRDEVDFVEFDEKYYLFGMKFEADPKRRPIFCVILENSENLGRKVRNRRLVWSDDLFFFRDYNISSKKSTLLGTISNNDISFIFLEVTGFLGQKLHYLGKISSDDLFF